VHTVQGVDPSHIVPIHMTPEEIPAGIQILTTVTGLLTLGYTFEAAKAATIQANTCHAQY
jgi:hypothetical protein